MARRRRLKDKRREETKAKKAKETPDRKLWTLALAGVVIILLIAGIFAIVSVPRSGQPSQGTPAPDFALVNSRGQSFSLSEFRGKPVVLFFMTTGDWCLPCKVETRDHLRPLYDAFGNRVQIISIEMIPSDYGDDDLNAYAATYGTNWIYARDTIGVSQRYGITTLSTVVIVDANGNIVFSGADPSFDVMSNVLVSLGVSRS
ncbi:MAG: redoxin domain-containing protein [Candidatus Geothermarchaeales archaeon]